MKSTSTVDSRALGGVPTAPLKAASAANFKVRTLVRPSPSRAVVRAGLGVRLFGAAFVVMAPLAPVLHRGFSGPGGGAELLTRGVVYFIGTGFALTGLAILFGVSRVVFDRQVGEAVTTRFGRVVGRRPLRAIRAVQCVGGVRHESSEGGYVVEQVNLVVEDEATGALRRENLLNQMPARATRQMGKDLAEFLGVPLLEVGDGGGAAASL
jgi:hypothetical protein